MLSWATPVMPCVLRSGRQSAALFARRADVRACATSATSPRVGFLGCGNMGGAILSRLVSCGVLDPATTLASARSEAALDRVEAAGIPRENLLRGPTANEDLVRGTDVVVLGVKPQVAPAVLAAVAPAFSPSKHLLVSLAAAFSVDSTAAALSCPDARIVRAIPSMAAAIGESCTAMVAGQRASSEDVAFVTSMFEKCGSVELLPSEALLSSATACILPTFTYIALEAIADAAVLEGLPRDIAQRLAANSVRSAAALAAHMPDKHPAALRNAAESPGGITIRATRELERGGFRASIMNAVSAATKPSFD